MFEPSAVTGREGALTEAVTEGPLTGIVVRGAREHNLKDVNVVIPRGKMTVITGLSGSGKSSLALDTIYAEGRRRYVESLSAYARQFLGVLEKPDVDRIDGLSPAIAIEQRNAGSNPRSTVGTVTEIYDYLRLLWARAGVPHCTGCGQPVRAQSPSEIAAQVLSWPEGERIEILAPLVRGRKGEFRDLFGRALKEGYIRARVDGELVELSDPPTLARNRNHDISVIVDRLVVRARDRERLADSTSAALRMASGIVEIAREGARQSEFFSERYACPDCGGAIPELEPRQMSFNSPYGACPECEGLGTERVPREELVIGWDGFSVLEGVLLPYGQVRGARRRAPLARVADKLRFSLEQPWAELGPDQREAVLYGDSDARWEGLMAWTLRRYNESSSPSVRAQLEPCMAVAECRSCHGARLRPSSRAVTFESMSLPDTVALPVSELLPRTEAWLAQSENGGGPRAAVRTPILREVSSRLRFLTEVGLGYLTLDRAAQTLSGGEAQRIRLATQIGSRLVGVLYVLDEPSIGLHPRDNYKLLNTLEALRDLGNTVVLVEHDEQTIRRADYVVDMGPGAGRDGGTVTAAGQVDEIAQAADSLTGAYLRGDRQIETPRPSARRAPNPDHMLRVRGARGHNLRNIDAEFPLGLFICVTGVSGSGKSTLVDDTLYRALARTLHRARGLPGSHDGVDGLEHLDKVIRVDQTPIGRTPRSNPATYTGLFTAVRDMFSRLPESQIRGYAPGRFSFNLRGGRCEPCRGDGSVKIEMHFLPDVYARCDVCRGRRYNRETLEVLYRGRSIADVLEMTVSEALEFFGAVPSIARRLKTLDEVGLGYVRLGQPATTLSGGEAQRVKLSSELARTGGARTAYILDEPTTGLHFEDVRLLLGVLRRLTAKGGTVIVIEHNLDVMKTADWIVDLGPEGGDRGGRIIAAGPPEAVARSSESRTGHCLAPVLAGNEPALA